MPGETLSYLSEIRVLVRRLTRSPSASQLSDTDIDKYVNTFVLYDFPEHLKMTYLRTTFTFYTTPYIDTYSTVSSPTTSPLYNFKNKYQVVAGPMYVAGRPMFFTQSREQFLAMHPMTMQIRDTGTLGDGINTVFTGTLSNVPIIRNNVCFTSIDANNNAIVLKDNGFGFLVVPNSTATSAVNIIDYVTGAYMIDFPVAPANGKTVYSQTYSYMPSIPQTILFFENSFSLRPVPDQAYPINMEVYKRPTELLSSNQEPELAEWWQYIAYGAAKKVLEGRMDPDTVQIIMPEFKKQEELILNRVAAQQSDQRVATIYTENSNLGSVFYFNNGSY